MRMKRTQQGITVVELMVAMLLGLILTAGLVQIFTGSQRSFRMAEALGRVQETGRIASDILSRDIRNADYWGCTKHSRVKTLLDENHAGYDVDVHGFTLDENVETISVKVATAGDAAVTGSHILTLRGASGPGIRLTSAMDSTSEALDVTSVAGLEAGDILLLSDCSDGVIFQATQVSGGASPKIEHATGGAVTPGNSAAEFVKAFESGEIYKPYVRRYEVQEKDGRYGLYLINGSDPALELLEDVVDMRIQVGEAAGPDGTTIATWKDASDGGVNFDLALALRVSLLVRSEANNVVENAQSLCFPAWDAACVGADPTNWTAPDRRKYQVYTTTTSIRNRLIPDITGS